MSLLFRRENPSKSRYFWGRCNGKKQFYDGHILSLTVLQKILNFFKKICIFQSSAVWNQKGFEDSAKKMTAQLWWSPMWHPYYIFQVDKFCVKRPQRSKNDNPWHLNMVSSFSNKNSIYPVTTTFHDYTETYESFIRVNITESLQNVYKWKLLH